MTLNQTPNQPARPYIASHPRPILAAASKHRYGRKTYTCRRANTILTRPARALAGTGEFALRLPRRRPSALLPQTIADAATHDTPLRETFFGEVLLDNLRATRRHPHAKTRRPRATNRYPARRARLGK